MTTVRRTFLKNTAAAALAAALPTLNFAQTPASRSNFAPQSGSWRMFEVTTRVDIPKPEGVTRVWLPVPSVNSDYQTSLENSFTSNGTGKFMQDGQEGAKMLYVEFAASEAAPFIELTSRVKTQNPGCRSLATFSCPTVDPVRCRRQPGPEVQPPGRGLRGIAGLA